MNKAMTIAYEVGDGIYLNITNRCSNACEFCIRNNGDGAYGSDPLWLLYEPSVEEIVTALFSRELTKYSELVFCGYGEPTCRLLDALKVAAIVKEMVPTLPIRINTNGHSDLILGMDTAPLYKGVFDVVSISLNAPTKEKYNAICHPVFKNEAFDAIISFASRVKDYVSRVQFSVVRQTLTEDELSECEAIARHAGVHLYIRDYIEA